MSEDEVRTLGEWDWWLLPRGRVLHGIQKFEYNDEFETQGGGYTTCGRRGWLEIPGFPSRLLLPRCAYCCALLGYPRGNGSPKNDAACRPLVEARLAALP